MTENNVSIRIGVKSPLLGKVDPLPKTLPGGVSASRRDEIDIFDGSYDGSAVISSGNVQELASKI